MSRPVLRSRPAHRTRAGRSSLLLAAALLFIPPLDLEAQMVPGGVYAIRGTRLVTVSGEVIESGTIVVRGGLIEALGRDVQPPPDAVVVEGSGLTVYPGFIDAFSQAGLVLAPAREREPAPNIADRSAAEWFDPADPNLVKYRQQGFTTALIARNDGVFSGQAVLMNLLGDATGGMTVKSPVAQILTYSSQRDYPGTLMAVVAYQRQALIDAQYQDMLLKRYARRPQGMERPAHEPALEAMIPAASGQAPFLVEVHVENDFKRLRDLAREYGMKFWITGAQEGYRVADLVKQLGAPVIVSLNLPAPERVTGYWFDRAYRNLSDEQKKELDARDNAAIQGNAATLRKAGLTIALSTSGLSDPSRFLVNLRSVIKAGLPADEALKALTITPARLFGVEGTHGSLEAGKAANLTVTSGDLFSDEAAYVTHLFVDGRMESFEQPRPRTPGARAGGGVAGAWEISITLPGQNEQVVLTLSQEGTSVKGEITTPMGPVAVSGTFEQGTLNLSGDVADMGNLTLTAAVEGDVLNGSISLGPMEAITITGKKRPSEAAVGEGGSDDDR